MEFQKQCRRFNNFRVLDESNFKRSLESISCIGTFKTTLKGNQILNRIVVIDNKEKSIFIINESDGQLIKELNHKKYLSYGLCCTKKASNNYIYVTDHSHNCIRKYDENLNELKVLETPEPMNGPCQLAINKSVDRLDVVDQKNHRIVQFSLQNDEYIGEFRLYKGLFDKDVKKPLAVISLNSVTERQNAKDDAGKLIDCWPFGIYSKKERIYVTDWSTNCIFVYKNQNLEFKIDAGKIGVVRMRDILIDSVDSILISDIYKKSVFIFDNRGSLQMEVKLPFHSSKQENGIFGFCKIDSNYLVFASNSKVYINSFTF